MKSIASRLKAKALRTLNLEPPPPLNQAKVEIVDFAFASHDFHSFADLGGVWRINGGYTFHALDNHDITSGAIVDTHPTRPVTKRAEGYDNLRVIQGNFGDEAIAGKVGKVDVIFLFDVLVHQVAPDWNRILEIYADQTECFVIYNPQWIGTKQTVRLLELGEEEYFKNVPPNDDQFRDLFKKLDTIHPDHDRPWRDVHHIWQWGITDADLRKKVESLGFTERFFKNAGQHGTLENFENHSFVFTK